MNPSRKINICHFTSVHKADDIRIFHKECVSLAKNNFEVTLVAPNCVSQVLNGVKIIGVESKTTGRISRMRQTTRKIFETVKNIDADIYHFHDPELLPYGKKLIKMGKKVVYDVHEDVPRQILGKPWINKLIRKFISRTFEKYENRIASQLSGIAAATPFIRDRFLKLNKNTIDICNSPLLEENHDDADWSRKENEICYVGAITHVRGIVELIQALEFMDVKLNLAGTFSPASLRDEVSALPGWKKVNEYGFVGRDKIKIILQRSKVGIVTLHPQINYLDSLPIKMFEYMHAGIPVVASDFPYWRKILEPVHCAKFTDPMWTAMTTSSKIERQRSMMSRCPLWMGSKDPG